MRLPRDLTGQKLARALAKLACEWEAPRCKARRIQAKLCFAPSMRQRGMRTSVITSGA